MQISGTRATTGLVSIALLWLALAQMAGAARVDDLYATAVPVADESATATGIAFRDALKNVLVRVTGRAASAEDAALLGRLGDPGALVQQYRHDGMGQLWVRFDGAGLRRMLEGAGVPAWGENRPLTVIWLAYDGGAGERDVLAAEGNEGAAADLRRTLLAAAGDRAVPVVLPLRDSEELAAVTYADVWGDFSEPLVRASQRYRADAILLGRARLYPPGMDDVRWTLLLGNERQEWRGTVADGPRGLAERLAERFATAPGAAGGSLRLAVAGVGSIDQYGALLAHLRGLDSVDAIDVTAASGDTLLLELRLRGSREQLLRGLALRGQLEPLAEGPTGSLPLADDLPVLHYRLRAAR